MKTRYFIETLGDFGLIPAERTGRESLSIVIIHGKIEFVMIVIRHRLMLLRSLMDDNQLDFNQPFLSVRRFPSTSPSEKDDRRKAHNNPRPAAPPFRSELKSGPISNPGAVPFLWEQSPGRPKDERKPHIKSLERPPVAPKLPPGRVLKVTQQAPNKASEAPMNCEVGKSPSNLQDVSSIKETIRNIESADDVQEKDSSGSEDGDEAYADALDTLSRTESFFLNCSVTGMSGFNSPVVTGMVSTDPETRDFMMSRFLPAAKAMASETPNYAPRKPRVWDQPRQVKEEPNKDKRPPIYRSRPNILPNYEEPVMEEESDDEDDAYDNRKHLPTALCGLLPKFCLLNPLPAMSVRTRVPISPVNRKQARSPSHQVATHEPRFVRGTQKRDEDPRRDNKLDQIPYVVTQQKLEGSSLYNRLQGYGESPKKNELTRSTIYEENRNQNVHEEAQVMKNSDFNEREEIGSTPTSPIVEKTLYIDSVQKTSSPKWSSFSSDRFIKNCSGDLEETPSVDSFHKEFEKSKEDTQQPKSVSTCSGKSDHEVDLEAAKDNGHERVPSQELLLSSTDMEFTKNGSLDYEDKQKLSKLENLGSLFPLPPPAPKSPSESWLWRTLPSVSSKKSSRSHFGTQMNGRYQASSNTVPDQKWETIVKSTTK